MGLPWTKYPLLKQTAARGSAPQMRDLYGNDLFTPSATFPDWLAQILFHIPVNNGNRIHHNSATDQHLQKRLIGLIAKTILRRFSRPSARVDMVNQVIGRAVCCPTGRPGAFSTVTSPYPTPITFPGQPATAANETREHFQ
jgi:hypothetical protein